VALDIGTSKVRAVVGELREDDHIFIIGVGESPSRGVRKGEIVDFETALSCTRVALHNAQDSGNVAIEQVYLMVSGGHLQSLVHRGSIPIIGGGEITRDHVDQVMEASRTVNLPPEREILHTISQQFYVDDQEGVVNPEGMDGTKLAMDMLILHGVRNRLKNTVKLARSVPIDVEDVAFGGICSALAVLSKEDKESGVLVMDLGGGTTNYVAYAGNTIAALGSLAVGGDHITNDLARGLRIPLRYAERLKEEVGSARIDLAARGQKVELPAESIAGRYVRLGDLQLITSLRAEEILVLVKDQLEQKQLIHHLGAGVILTGGGAHLKGMSDLVEKVFGLPCFLGRPKDFSGLAVSTQGPEYATALGLLRYGARTGRRAPRGLSLAGIWEWMFGGGQR
jgi:cell division protein FtsA